MVESGPGRNLSLTNDFPQLRVGGWVTGTRRNLGWAGGSVGNVKFVGVGGWVVQVNGILIVPTPQKNTTLLIL